MRGVSVHLWTTCKLLKRINLFQDISRTHCNCTMMYGHVSWSWHYLLCSFNYRKSRPYEFHLFHSGNIFARENNSSVPEDCHLASHRISRYVLIAFSLFNKTLHDFLPPLSLLSQKLKDQSLHYGHGKLAGLRSALMFHCTAAWLPGCPAARGQLELESYHSNKQWQPTALSVSNLHYKFGNRLVLL